MKKKSDDPWLFYVYVDWTDDPNSEIQLAFYVGKGNENRVRGTERNNHHKHIAAKHGMVREVIFETVVEQEAFAKEIEMIAEYHTFVDDPEYNGFGCNYTPGGEGHTPTKAECARISKRWKAMWADPVKRAAWCQAMRDGGNGKVKSPAWCKAHSESMKGEKHFRFGKHLPQETCDKISASKKGKKIKRTKKSLLPAPRALPIVVTDGQGTVTEYVRIGDAARAIAALLNLKPNYVASYMNQRRASFRDFKFAYPPRELTEGVKKQRENAKRKLNRLNGNDSTTTVE